MIQNAPSGITTNAWDAENRLTQIVLPSAVVNTMLYNADGQRADHSGTSNLIWDFQNVLLETNASNVTQALYTLSPNVYGNQISQSRSAASSFYHFNALGSAIR